MLLNDFRALSHLVIMPFTPELEYFPIITFYCALTWSNPKPSRLLTPLFLCFWMSKSILCMFWCQIYTLLTATWHIRSRGWCKKKNQIVFYFCSFVMCCVLLDKVQFARCTDTMSLVISPFTWYVRWLYLETTETLVRHYVFKARCLCFVFLFGRKYF